MRVRVAKRFKFDAAHYLPHYEGKCRNMHGHTWWVEVEIIGEVEKEGPNQGMVMDFSSFRELLTPELDMFDHHILNRVIGLPNPTAENIAMFLYKAIQDQCPLVSITVWESPDSYAKVIADDQVPEAVEDSYSQVLAEGAS